MQIVKAYRGRRYVYLLEASLLPYRLQASASADSIQTG